MRKSLERAAGSGWIKSGAENLVGFVFSTIFGGLLTIAVFYATSSPTSSAEVREQLTRIARASVQKELGEPVQNVTLNSFVSESLDLSPSNSVFVFGTAVAKGNETNRFLAVFEPSSQDLIDRLVGRPGFYELKYSAIIPVSDSASLLPSEIVIEDIDRDGNKDILIYVKSIRADSTASGLAILKKDKGEIWHLLAVPSLTERLRLYTSGLPQNPEGLRPPGSPTIWFGTAGDTNYDLKEQFELYKGFDIHEETVTAMRSGSETELTTLRNGGKIKIFDHPNAGYRHIGVASYVIDGNAVLDAHRVMVTFFKIEDDRLVIDSLWNWGYPMLSVEAEDIATLDLDEFHEAGLSNHVVGGTFYGYTEFWRVNNIR